MLLLNNERFLVPELLFHPRDIGLDQAGLPEATMQVRAVCGWVGGGTRQAYQRPRCRCVLCVCVCVCVCVCIGGGPGMPSQRPRCRCVLCVCGGGGAPPVVAPIGCPALFDSHIMAPGGACLPVPHHCLLFMLLLFLLLLFLLLLLLLILLILPCCSCYYCCNNCCCCYCCYCY